MTLAVVTASLLGTASENWERYWRSWRRLETRGEGRPYRLIHVQSPFPRGSLVEPFASPEEDYPEHAETVLSERLASPVEALILGVTQGIGRGCDPIAVFHDDLQLLEEGWNQRLVEAFRVHPRAGLIGYGGGLGLGDPEIYSKPYSPYDLARRGFVSNMRDAEAHGTRITTQRQVACLDGFSLVGSVAFWLHALRWLKKLGVRHHGYDSGLGALAHRLRMEVWVVPEACHHAGGATAVGNPRWEEHLARVGSSDRAEWERSHKEIYEDLRDVLPIGEYGGGRRGR